MRPVRLPPAGEAIQFPAIGRYADILPPMTLFEITCPRDPLLRLVRMLEACNSLTQPMRIYLQDVEHQEISYGAGVHAFYSFPDTKRLHVSTGFLHHHSAGEIAWCVAHEVGHALDGAPAFHEFAPAGYAPNGRHIHDYEFSADAHAKRMVPGCVHYARSVIEKNTNPEDWEKDSVTHPSPARRLAVLERD